MNILPPPPRLTSWRHHCSIVYEHVIYLGDIFIYLTGKASKIYFQTQLYYFSTLKKDFFGCPKNLSLAPDPATAWNSDQRPALVSGLPSEQSKYYRRWTKPRGIALFI